MLALTSVLLKAETEAPGPHQAEVKAKDVKARKAELEGVHTLWHCGTVALRFCRQPKHPWKRAPWRSKFDHCVIKFPLTTESAGLEDRRQRVFLVGVKANKHGIKQAVRRLCNTNMAKVCDTDMIRPEGKKVYVQLVPDFDVVDIANKTGIN